jgi:hypothetical protein
MVFIVKLMRRIFMIGLQMPGKVIMGRLIRRLPDRHEQAVSNSQ